MTASDAATFGTSSDSLNFPVGLVSSAPCGARVVTFALSSEAPILRVEDRRSVSSGGGRLANIAQFDERLRKVETDVAQIGVRLEHMPTTAQLWKAVAYSAGTVLLAILGAAAWAVKAYLQPILGALKLAGG